MNSVTLADHYYHMKPFTTCSTLSIQSDDPLLRMALEGSLPDSYLTYRCGRWDKDEWADGLVNSMSESESEVAQS